MDDLTISAISPIRGLHAPYVASKRRRFAGTGTHRGSRFMSRLLNLLLGIIVLLSSAVTHAGTVTYVYTDPQGTPLAEANASGTITATFDYKPYGSQALGSPKAGPGYTGHVNDPDTGFVYMQARYYDPVVGRFLSVDPVGPKVGNAFNFTRYIYAVDNPIENIDPDGRQNTFDAGYWAGVAQLTKNQSPAATQQVNQMSAGQARMLIYAGAALAATPAAAFVTRTAGAVAATTLESGSLTTGLLMHGQDVTASVAIVGDALAAANGAPSTFSDEALVVRGGAAANQTAAKIDAAIGPSRTPGVTGFSAQCDGGTCLSTLGANLRNGQLGVTTVGEIRAAGGQVIATPGMGSHVTVTGLTGDAASPLMKIVKNPNPAK